MIAGIFIGGLALSSELTPVSRLLSLARCHGSPLAENSEPALAGALGFGDIGPGNCRALALGLRKQGRYYLCADPVHLVPNRDQLVMDRAPVINDAEADDLISELSNHFSIDNIVFHKLTAQRWLIETSEKPDISTHAPTAVTGKHVYDYLPQGNDAIRWHAFLTEAQGLLHMSRVNEQRIEQPVNSIWLWGEEGSSQDPQEINWSSIYTDDPFVEGMAKSAGCQYGPLDSAESIPGSLLVITPEVVQKTAGILESYEQYCSYVYSHWLKPLISALKQNTITELAIYTEQCPPFILRRRMLYRFWKRNRPVQACGQSNDK